jgi:meso-butanediol dehydrogenase/(S,S)-butanediol dehydrogenase/diacetyl reductase
MSRLNGKVAIVTGGAQGIGRAIALQLARDGAAVAVGDLRKEGADAVAAEIVAAGGQGAAYAVDVSAEAGPAELVAQTVARFGHLDVMVANAGIMQVKPLLELTAGDWDAMFAVNVRGVFLSFQAAARQIR